MLLTLATQQPRMLLTVVQHTPNWVWMLLAALIWLGASQCFARSAGLRRVLLMPIAMAVFSAWGMASAFGGASQIAGILAAWLVTACAVAAVSLWLHRTPPAGARYDAASQRFHLPGSAWPLLLIVIAAGTLIQRWRDIGGWIIGCVGVVFFLVENIEMEIWRIVNLLLPLLLILVGVQIVIKYFKKKTDDIDHP